MMFQNLLAMSPYLEVLVRNVYWRNPSLVRFVQRRKLRKNRVSTQTTPRIAADDLRNSLWARGVKAGDILVVHSDYAALSGMEQTPREIIDELRRIVGPSGTIAMPAIPVLRGALKPPERIRGDVAGMVLEYNPKTSPAWTGALPNALVKYPGAIRSLHPLNTMVAVGPHAEAMMSGNLSGHRPLPCGRQSSWYYCYQNEAKVLALGADLAHSLTMIHVAEDMDEDTWSARQWYRDRTFKIVCDGCARLHEVRERHPRWAMHYAERTLSRDLLREGIMTRFTLSTLTIELLESHNLIRYLRGRNGNGYPYYLVPAAHRLRH